MSQLDTCIRATMTESRNERRLMHDDDTRNAHEKQIVVRYD